MKRSSRGFTLMELMVTLALAAVVFGLGVPAFREFGKNGRLTGAANEMLVTLMTARNEAVRRQVRTSFCPSETPDSNLAICDSDATEGYIAFVDENDNCQRDDDEELVSSFVTHSEIKTADNISCIGYGASGFRIPVAGQPANARAVFCDDRGIAKVSDGTDFSYARGVEVVATGRPATTRLYDELNTWAGEDDPVTCP
ncbi:MAG TPA: GspH/FimT family pseudopilin [Steroidobacteraceae bacterium]|nr:GspH/FimT family pseudopilin [Steroidobacteraceae bacterium]